METTKENLLAALAAFIGQRPGMDPNNYASARDYRAESRRVTKQAHDAIALLGAVARSSCINGTDLLKRARYRLTWTGTEWDYTPGQYFAVEYRRAAAELLAITLWDCYLKQSICQGAEPNANAMRGMMRNILGARLARKFFN